MSNEATTAKAEGTTVTSGAKFNTICVGWRRGEAGEPEVMSDEATTAKAEGTTVTNGAKFNTICVGWRRGEAERTRSNE